MTKEELVAGLLLIGFKREDKALRVTIGPRKVTVWVSNKNATVVINYGFFNVYGSRKASNYVKKFSVFSNCYNWIVRYKEKYAS